jgi:hypothetical protein
MYFARGLLILISEEIDLFSEETVLISEEIDLFSEEIVLLCEEI